MAVFLEGYPAGGPCPSSPSVPPYSRSSSWSSITPFNLKFPHDDKTEQGFLLSGRRVNAGAAGWREFRFETHEQAQPFPIHAFGQREFAGAIQRIQFVKRRAVVVSKPARRDFARRAQKRLQLRSAAAQRKRFLDHHRFAHG